MSVKKWTYASGEVTWSYCFDAPGSTKANRKQIREYGFESKKAATDAEVERRTEEKRKYELAQAKAHSVEANPKSLAALLTTFLDDYAAKTLASKTTEQYRVAMSYLSPELLAMPLADLKPLHFHREWTRLKESGGHHPRTKERRPLSANTVAFIVRFVSSAFERAIKWSLVERNPVKNSEPPKIDKIPAIALTPAQQRLVIDASSGPWCLRSLLEMSAATGCRRGELLALRWSDIVDDSLLICRSLCQTREKGLEFKSTKTKKPRPVRLPASVAAVLVAHKAQQDEFKKQFGPDYAEGDLVFANPDGTPLKPNSISAAVSDLFRKLKIPKPKGAGLHLLRHTHASHLLASGIPLPAVSARLGHRSIRTTLEVYAHMITGQDDEAAQAWEKYQKSADKGPEKKV